MNGRMMALGLAALAVTVALVGLVEATPIGGQSVNVLSLIPGVGATNLGKAEDAPHTSGDTGAMSLLVRQDTMAALAGTTGDYIPQTTDSLGRARTIQQQAATDGATPFSDLGATSTGTTPIQAQTDIRSLTFCNGDSATATGKVYDKATAATSSDTPKFRIRALAGTCSTVPLPPEGAQFANGVSFRAVTENTDAGTTGVTANTAMFNGTKI